MAKRKTFYVSAAIFSQPHSAYAVAVYAYLSFCADKQGVCFPSIETISKHTGMSRSSVQRSLVSLETEGLIRSEATFQTSKSGKVRRGTNRYHLLNMPADTALSEPAPRVSGNTLPGSQMTDPRISENTPHVSQTTHPRVSENREINKNSKDIMGDVPSVGITGREATDRDGLDEIFERIHLDCYFDQVFAQSVRQTIERMYASPYITVNGQRIGQDAVRERLKLLTIDHIDFVEAQLDEHGGEITHGERYLMSCIFNAPVDVLVNTSGAGSQLFR